MTTSYRLLAARRSAPSVLSSPQESLYEGLSTPAAHKKRGHPAPTTRCRTGHIASLGLNELVEVGGRSQREEPSPLRSPHLGREPATERDAGAARAAPTTRADRLAFPGPEVASTPPGKAPRASARASGHHGFSPAARVSHRTARSPGPRPHGTRPCERRDGGQLPRGGHQGARPTEPACPAGREPPSRGPQCFRGAEVAPAPLRAGRTDGANSSE